MKAGKSRKYMGVRIRARGSKWQVDFGTRNGKRNQKSYDTQEGKDGYEKAIRDFKEERRLEVIDEKNKRIGLHSLTDVERGQVANAMDKLAGVASVETAVDFYLKHTRPEGGPMTLAALLENYTQSKVRANRRERTVDGLKSKPGRFVRERPDMMVHEVSTSMLESWMDAQSYKGTTRDDWRRAFVSMFNYAVKHKHAADNPAAAIDRVDRDETVAEVHTPAEAIAVLRAAEKHCPDMVPYFALGYFSGLRSAELEGLKWSNIDLARRRIKVTPETAKKRRQRYVDISDNLAAWLAPYAKQRGTVYFYRYHFDKVRKAAKVRWPRNVLRHSFGSYHLAAHDNAPKTARQMGHAGDTDMLFAHYAELVTPEDAAAFWGILPDSAGKVIQFAG